MRCFEHRAYRHRSRLQELHSADALAARALKVGQTKHAFAAGEIDAGIVSAGMVMY